MKRLNFFVFIIAFFLLSTVSGALAASNSDSPIKSVNDLISRLEDVVSWTYTIFFIIAIFFILLAAFSFLTASDDAEKINKARWRIIYAVIAIIIALISVSFKTIISKFLSGS